MVMTESQMLSLGTVAPAFELPDVEGQRWSLDSKPGAVAYLVVFMCNHCPYVKHIRSELVRLGREAEARGYLMLGINSNDATRYPDDSPEAMRAEIDTYGYTFPYLVDEDQTVARAFHAACTPDFFLFDGDRRLVYRGQLDDSRPANDRPLTGADLRAALEAVLAGQPVDPDQRPSVGCSIKWKPGNAPR